MTFHDDNWQRRDGHYRHHGIVADQNGMPGRSPYVRFVDGRVVVVHWLEPVFFLMLIVDFVGNAWLGGNPDVVG